VAWKAIVGGGIAQDEISGKGDSDYISATPFHHPSLLSSAGWSSILSDHFSRFWKSELLFHIRCVVSYIPVLSFVTCCWIFWVLPFCGQRSWRIGLCCFGLYSILCVGLWRNKYPTRIKFWNQRIHQWKFHQWRMNDNSLELTHLTRIKWERKLVDGKRTSFPWLRDERWKDEE